MCPRSKSPITPHHTGTATYIVRRRDPLSFFGVTATIEYEYVKAMDVIDNHIIAIRIHINVLRLKGNPLMSNKRVLRDATKLMVLARR